MKKYLKYIDPYQEGGMAGFLILVLVILQLANAIALAM